MDNRKMYCEKKQTKETCSKTEKIMAALARDVVDNRATYAKWRRDSCMRKMWGNNEKSIWPATEGEGAGSRWRRPCWIEKQEPCSRCTKCIAPSAFYGSTAAGIRVVHYLCRSLLPSSSVPSTIFQLTIFWFPIENKIKPFNNNKTMAVATAISRYNSYSYLFFICNLLCFDFLFQEKSGHVFSLLRSTANTFFVCLFYCFSLYGISVCF